MAFCQLYNTSRFVNRADAGYALSSSALRRFVEEKFPDVESCEGGGQHWKNGDWYLGRHLSELGIKPRDTRDHAGLLNLHLLTIELKF